MRYDRDKYIKVHYENIAPGLRSQFQKIGRGMSTTYGVKYDYRFVRCLLAYAFSTLLIQFRSVMHYRKDAFSRNGKVTMQTRSSKFQVNFL